MYFTVNHLKKAVENLKNIHPFFGISFLAFKSGELPIGRTTQFNISSYEKQILDNYFYPEESDWYFTPFKTAGKNKFWINKDYPGNGAQKTRTNQFKEAFLHEIGSPLWGWNPNYVQLLVGLMDRYQSGKKIPLIPLATWLFREHDWGMIPLIEDIISKFIKYFRISDQELNDLFELKTLADENVFDAFQNNPSPWSELKNLLDIPSAPDSPIEQGYYLSSIHFKNIPPFHNINVNIADRLNLFTGDNGLGKTLLLEAAWWGLSGKWVDDSVPNFNQNDKESSIKFGLTIGQKDRYITIKNDPSQEEWIIDKFPNNIETGLAIYQRVDGSVGVFDSSRKQNSSLTFDNQQLWDGYSIKQASKNIHICNGLIQDWSFWQTSDEESFTLFKEILTILSPPGLDEGDLGVMSPGKLVRMPGDSRLIPTIKHSYGDIPITIASAAVKRVLSLAYLIYWSWKEQLEQAKLNSRKPQRQLIILVDEVEAHLHPKWQRLILPAILKVIQLLTKERLGVQILVTTHSPLVMASIEPIFNLEIDGLFHFDLKNDNGIGKVTLEQIDFVKRGSANEWLKSEFLEIKQPFSIEAENAISEAINTMKANEKDLNKLKNINSLLTKNLPPHDTLWIRWNYFFENSTK
jgi:predicted ATPase